MGVLQAAVREGGIRVRGIRELGHEQEELRGLFLGEVHFL